MSVTCSNKIWECTAKQAARGDALCSSLFIKKIFNCVAVLGLPWRRKWQPTPVFLPGESPWTKEPGGLQSMGLQRVRHNWGTKQAQQYRQIREERQWNPPKLPSLAHSWTIETISYLFQPTTKILKKQTQLLILWVAEIKCQFNS